LKVFGEEIVLEENFGLTVQVQIHHVDLVHAGRSRGGRAAAFEQNLATQRAVAIFHMAKCDDEACVRARRTVARAAPAHAEHDLSPAVAGQSGDVRHRVLEGHAWLVGRAFEAVVEDLITGVGRATPAATGPG